MVSYDSSLFRVMPLIKISFSRLFGGALAALILLIGITLAVNSFGMFNTFDNTILQWFSSLHTPLFTSIFLAFTFLGNLKLILSATALLAVILFIKREFGYFLLFLGTIFGSFVFLLVFKLFTNRQRPTLFEPLVHETSFSFPSGHALLAVVFYGLLAYLAASAVKTQRARRFIFFLWIFLALAIGLSRLYLGVHYPTDVIAGYLAGFAWLCLGIGLFERYFIKTHGRR